MKTDNIQTLDDLRAERARLKNQLELSKVKMRQEVTSIKTELNPARQAVGVISDLLTTPKKGLLNVGVGIGVDVLIKKGLLARAGWLPRLVVPFIARNIATNLIQQNKTTLLENALMWVKKVTDKPKPEPKLLPAPKSPKLLNGKAPVIMDN